MFYYRFLYIISNIIIFIFRMANRIQFYSRAQQILHNALEKTNSNKTSYIKPLFDKENQERMKNKQKTRARVILNEITPNMIQSQECRKQSSVVPEHSRCSTNKVCTTCEDFLLGDYIVPDSCDNSNISYVSELNKNSGAETLNRTMKLFLDSYSIIHEKQTAESDYNQSMNVEPTDDLLSAEYARCEEKNNFQLSAVGTHKISEKLHRADSEQVIEACDEFSASAPAVDNSLCVFVRSGESELRKFKASDDHEIFSTYNMLSKASCRNEGRQEAPLLHVHAKDRKRTRFS